MYVRDERIVVGSALYLKDALYRIVVKGVTTQAVHRFRRNAYYAAVEYDVFCFRYAVGSNGFDLCFHKFLQSLRRCYAAPPPFTQGRQIS